MPVEKKFLDIEGVKVLWNQVNLHDYPNNETLVAVLNAIDKAKADQVYVDEKIGDIDSILDEINGIII